MKSIAMLALGMGLLGFVNSESQAQEKKEVKLAGKYTLLSGKTNGTAIQDEAKKGAYTFTDDRITIEGMGVKFVMSYKLDTATTPMNIDMDILEGPEGTKGTKAAGIFEMKDNMLKLAYSIEKDSRPKDFKGEKDFLFELKKAK